MNTIRRLLDSKRIYLFSTFILFILLRLPSLFEPLWYEDEGISSAIATNILHGKLFYIGVWNHKPPGLYVIYITLYKLFGQDLFYVKMASLIIGLVGLYFFYKIARIFLSEKLAYVTLIIYALIMGTPIVEGNITDAEVFFVPISLVAIYLLLKERSRNIDYILAGILFFVATLIKPPAFFDMFAVVLALILVKKINYKNLLLVISGFGIPWVITSTYFYMTYRLKDFFEAIISSNADYVSGSSFTIFNIPILPIKISLIIIATTIIIFLSLKKKISFIYTLLLLLVAWDTFSIFLSGRQYSHYMIQLIPSALLLLFYLLSKRKNNGEKHQVYIYIFGILSVLFIALIISFSPYIYSGGESIVVDNYYQNFTKLITGRISKTQFDSGFYIDPSISNEPYSLKQTSVAQVAKVIDQNSGSKSCIFVWTNLPYLYTLSDRADCTRYLVDFHISNISDDHTEVMDDLQTNPASIIITMVNEEYYFPQIDSLINTKYKLIKTIEYVKIYKHI